MSIGFVYDATIRNNGTAVRAMTAVKQDLGFGDNCRRYEPHGELPEQELYIYIDDGRDDIKWECPKPNAYWAIDTHLGWDYRLWKARQFDRVYCAQKEGAAKMRAEGINAQWLPLACHPPADPCYAEVMNHPQRDTICLGKGIDKQYDITFVGFLNEGVPNDPSSHNRVEFLDAMFAAFPNFFFAANRFFENAAVEYIRGRLGINISIRDDLNMRFFEVLSYGTAQLANVDMVGMTDLGFIDGTHYIGYKDAEEAISKTQYYLQNHEEREAIAKEGHILVRAKHTYAHRMAELLTASGIALPQRG